MDFLMLTATLIDPDLAKVHALVEWRRGPTEKLSLGLEFLTHDVAVTMQTEVDRQQWVLDQLRTALGE